MSLRNVVKRKTHKERAQPSFRARYGLLEKKKDYKLRAIDYHRKEDKLKKLKTAAALKNPDEFYFKMINATTTVSDLISFDQIMGVDVFCREESIMFLTDLLRL